MGLVLGLILLAVGAFAWYSAPTTAAPGSAESADAVSGGWDDAPVRIQVTHVRRKDLSLRKEATGYLAAVRRVEIKAEAGGRVIRRGVEEGMRVQKEHLLLQLDDRDRQLELEEAEAEWLKARALYVVRYESEPTDSVRELSAPAVPAGELEQMFEEGLISKQELLDRRRGQEREPLLAGEYRGAVRAASSGLAQAEQRLERSRLALERTRILAPFSGRVADIQVEAGQQIDAGESLLTLLEDHRLEVDVEVLEADIVQLRPGAPARVRVPALDGAIFEGTIATINPSVDPERGTGRVTVTLPNPRGRLLPGLFAYVDLETGRLANRLLVPVEAVLERQERELVFRVHEGRALWTYISTGERSGKWIEVTEGLNDGDLVAVGNHFALAHEAPVEATSVEATPVQNGEG